MLPQYDSPFGPSSIFNQSDWKRRLERFLFENKVSEFIYSNIGYYDGIEVRIRIRGVLNDGHLDIRFSSQAFSETTSFITKGVDYIPASEELKYLQNSNRFLVYKLNDKWNLCDKYMDERFGKFSLEHLIDGKRGLNDEEFQQLYYEFTDCSQRKADGLKRDFRKFCEDLKKQLSKKFYFDVKMAADVKLVDHNGKTITRDTVKANPDRNIHDITLDITLYSDGRIEIKQRINPDFLKQYLSKWQKEANARGLKVNVDEMRKDVIAFFESEEGSLNWGTKIARDIRTWYDDTVGGFIEAIQATHKIGKHIWEKGTINESTWYSKDQQHSEWPGYMQFEPVFGGVTDGVIDEIVGIPMICKSIYQLATSSEKRKEFSKIFSSEGLKQMKEGMKQEISDLAKDEEKLDHFTGQSVVSVISMLSGIGLIARAGKIDEFIDVAEKGIKKTDELPNAKFYRINDLVKKSKRTVADEKAFKELIEEVGEDAMSEASGELIDLSEKALRTKKKFTWEEVKAFFKRGNDYNKKVKDMFPNPYLHHEVTVEKIFPDGTVKRFRLDSYNPGKDIVSRKATDFDKIQLSTFEGYLKEFEKKYAVGTKVVATDPEIRGKLLVGEYKIEVPLHNKNFSRLKEFEDLAKKYKVEIIYQAE